MSNPAIGWVKIPSYVSHRSFDGKLCLINQRRREVWICAGMSLGIWEMLRQDHSVEHIAGAFSAKYHVPAEKVKNDVERFVVQLWKRQIVDLSGREHISDAERAAMLKEEPHNKNGKMYEAALDAKIIFRAWLDLLVPCNLRCRHCYLDFSQKDIVPLKDVYNYLDQLADHGCPDVHLTGGEIFLRKDLPDIVAYTESKGFLFDLYTNGTFIDEVKADRLSRHLITTVQISIYGTNAPVHEKITKEPGTFDKSINAAKLLIERGVPVRLQYHIQQDNFDDAFKFPEFATALGATYEFDTKLVPNRDGSKEPLRYSVTVQQMAQIYQANLMKRETNFICPAAVSKARITAHGDVYPCDLINTAVMGNLKQETLAEIWGSEKRTRLREQILSYKPNRCGGCHHVSDCEPCAAMRGFGHQGHMEAPFSEACMLTTASLLAQGKEIARDSPFVILTT